MLSILLVLLLLLVGLVLIQQYFGLPILAKVRARLYMEDLVWHGLGKSPSTHILNSDKAVDTWSVLSSVTPVAAWACDIIKNESSRSFFVMPLSSRCNSSAQDGVYIMLAGASVLLWLVCCSGSHQLWIYPVIWKRRYTHKIFLFVMVITVLMWSVPPRWQFFFFKVALGLKSSHHLLT